VRLRHLLVNDKENLAHHLVEAHLLNQELHQVVDLVDVLQNLDELNRDVNLPSVDVHRDAMAAVLVDAASAYFRRRMDYFRREVDAASWMLAMAHLELVV
jgi:hypothetical protein